MRCERRVEGWVAFGEADPTGPGMGASVVVDSGGFMVFAEGIVCDDCLGEGRPG
jgi:hypothetical protein